MSRRSLAIAGGITLGAYLGSILAVVLPHRP